MPDPAKLNPINLADGFAPPLPAGRYTVTAKQQLKISSEKDPIEFEADKTVHVSAPRFLLNPGDVYSVYPPAGQEGAFHEALPHIVLTRKTLPWERSVKGVETEKEQIRAPWMALLTLDDDEIANGKIEINSIPLSELYKPPSDTSLVPPEIVSEDGERLGPPPAQEDRCVVARMPAELFRNIAPAHDELRFLAHARKVGSDDKDLADAIADNWVAIVVGNRLPKSDANNHGLLVSLEGLGGVLKRKRSEGTGSDWSGKWVQPVVLHHWTYVCEQQTFRQLLEALTEKGGEKKDVWLRVSPVQDTHGNEATEKDDEKEADSKALAALNLGYTALGHHLRQGGRTVSWYRGPLIPVPFDTGPNPDHPVYTNADAALQYDPGTGFFNVSYAAAWQLGRLLAMQNLEIATSLLHRTGGYIAREVLKEAKNILNQAEGLEEQAKLLLQDELMVGLLTEWWFSDPTNAGEDDRGRR